MHQGSGRRTVGETIEAGWSLLETLPREDWTRIPDPMRAARRGPGEGGT